LPLIVLPRSSALLYAKAVKRLYRKED